MKITIGVDWSDQAFAAVQQALHLYRSTEVTLVHGVDLGIFEYPIVAEAANMQGYDDFRRAMLDAGRQLMERTSNLIPPDSPSVRTVCEFGSPARVILDTAQATAADLIAVGARGRGRIMELMLGSVSHRVLMHASQSTLVAKGPPRPIQRVLVAIEGSEDAQYIHKWLLAHPFKNPVELTVLTVVQSLRLTDPFHTVGLEAWSDAAMRFGEDLVKTTAASLASPFHTVGTLVCTGEPADTVAQQSNKFDLVIVGSHGRKGVERFLLGSVSHSIIHRASCPILVVR